MDASSSSPEPSLSSTDCLSSQNRHPKPPDSSGDDTAVTSKKKKTMRTKKKVDRGDSSSSCSSRRIRVVCKRRLPRVAFGSRSVGEAVSSRLGMSIAAFVAEILELRDGRRETMCNDHLAFVCASAVRESLANDFGGVFDSFVSNFEKSFGSTFRTLKLIKELSTSCENSQRSGLNMENCSSGRDYVVDDYVSRKEIPGDSAFISEIENRLNPGDLMEGNEVSNSIGLELALRNQTNELTHVSSNSSGTMSRRSVLSTFERSVSEQARSNNLKNLEINLTMKKMRMKETELALNYDLNNLERSKLAMGISKASFKAEKFKTQLEDARYAELVRKCVDCLVAGLLLMGLSLVYGAYIYSYQKITEATASCTPSTKESKSWWISNPMTTFYSGFQILSCQFQVVTQMLFGLFMILAVVYLIFQRSSSSQAMPVTFMIFLLALVCGGAGKFCVDTLGGSGYHWLILWETICAVHFLCNVCTSTLFVLLYGPLVVRSDVPSRRILPPYWVRRAVFYVLVLIVLPLLCGLLPFAGIGEWKNHIVFRIEDRFSRDGFD